MSKNNEDNKVKELIKAIRKHNVTKAEELISVLTPEQIKVTDHLGRNLLHIAAMHEELLLLKILVEKADDKVINHCNFDGPPLYSLIMHNEIIPDVTKIGKDLLKKMNKAAITKQIGYFWYTVLHQVTDYKPNLELCEAILKACPSIINMKTREGKTALDLIGWIYTTETFELAKLLCEHGGIFNLEKDVTEKFKSWTEPIKMIDQIFELKELEANIKIDQKFYEMLVNRFQFKLLQKFGVNLQSEDFTKYTSYLHNIAKNLPVELYNGLKVSLNKIYVTADLLSMYEAELINIFESTENEPKSIVPFKLLRENYNKFNMSNPLLDTPEQRTLDFYGANLKYTEVGTYLFELLNDADKLNSNPEGLEIIKRIKSELLLPESLKMKLEEFLETCAILEEIEAATTALTCKETQLTSTEEKDAAGTDELQISNHLIDETLQNVSVIGDH